MRKRMIGLLIFGIGAAPQPLLAQNMYSEPFSGPLKEIIDQGIGDRNIAPDERTDLSKCNGADEKGVVQAIESCWPVLETYRLLAELSSAMREWKALPSEKQMLVTPQSTLAGTLSDDILRRAASRKYPAEDIARVIAFFSRAQVAMGRDDPNDVYRNMVGADIVISMTRIDALRNSKLAAFIRGVARPD
ncbi:hypothetical protein [Sphingopyxis sp. Root1497]|uniref:hypothetical protein n=1 Tax=Sphingopyxis sp. Root1497 TaxID=1736474 RepID=UPI0012E3AF18|nr:hypothetical protein [Sphingopyxis sp. Root1497]